MRRIAIFVTGVMAIFLVACTKESGQKMQENGKQTAKFSGQVELNVTTTYGGNDGNVWNYLESMQRWQEETGNKINDISGVADEAFKARVIADFESGAEPDVLFYFSGKDSNSIVLADKVVSIEEIRQEYPEYASNMVDSKMEASPVDGVKYAVPVNGYWEGLYINKEVLEACGIKFPGEDYTWEAFLEDCDIIKQLGYTPIAASLANVPNYWFEFAIYNQLTPQTHCKLPASVEDEAGKAWVDGLNEIKDLYEKGYFPENTLSASDDETFQMFLEGKAAFLLDGSWKLGSIESETDNIDNFVATYVPGKGKRKTTDIIGGVSSGYYITRKAWENPKKREAAVDFVKYMTADEVVSKFATTSPTALKNEAMKDETELTSLEKSCISMVANATGITGAVQDLVPQDCRVPIFEGMPDIVTGKIKAEDAVQQVLDLLQKQNNFE